MKPKALITGITGFVGSHLAEFLLEQGVEVYGTVRFRSPRDNIRHVEKQLNLVECELTDALSVKEMLSKVQPDEMYHLAAQSFVPSSWNAPDATFQVNVLGQIHLFEACRSLGISPRIQVACSSEEYGLVYSEEVPISETNPLRPLSPYGVSKVAQDLLAYQYFQSYHLPVIRTRAFNHTGPRRGEAFVTSNFARQIAAIEAGLQDPVIKVGNLLAERDFTDVRDMVRGYYLAIRQGEPGEVYNLASGKALRIACVLEILLGCSSARIEVEQDPARVRPSDVPLLQGDYGKFAKRTGWRPVIPIEQTLLDLLNHWRRRLTAA